MNRGGYPNIHRQSRFATEYLTSAVVRHTTSDVQSNVKVRTKNRIGYNLMIKDICPAVELPYCNSLSENTDGRRDGDHRAFVQNILLAIDFSLICISALASWYFRFVFQVPAASVWSLSSRERFEHDMAFLLLYAILFVLFAYARKLYTHSLTVPRRRAVFDVLKSSGSAALIVTSFIYLSGNKLISREVIGATVLLSAATLAIRRLTFPGRSSAVHRNVVIVGAGRVGQALSRYLSTNPLLGYTFIGYIDRHRADRYSSPEDLNDTASILGSIEDLEVIGKTYFIDEILVTLSGDRNLVKDVALYAKGAGIDLRVVPDLYDGLAYGVPVEFIGQFPLLAVHQEQIPTLQLFLKRVFDGVVSASALLFFMPLFAVVALAIKLDSRGPVFHHSNRVGKKGRTFPCHKFRTMVVDAERQQKDLAHLNERDGVLFKIDKDPRITSMGRLLRKYSIDELPQLWNVLKGEMSLVGPRPPLPGEYKQYAIGHLRRFEVVPGITGLWQVEARQSPSFDDYINLDLEYVENWSIWLDFNLLLRTVLVVLAGTGS
jgi:exopolysaccharide biosynthesis polyprenyl glycosylphosphotransferase